VKKTYDELQIELRLTVDHTRVLEAELSRLTARIQDAETALAIWDESRSSEYWERYAALAGGSRTRELEAENKAMREALEWRKQWAERVAERVGHSELASWPPETTIEEFIMNALSVDTTKTR
jgi:hypothetical protein